MSGKITLTGIVERDPYIKSSAAGRIYCKFIVAVSYIRGTTRDNLKEVTDLRDCVAWSDMITACKNLKKGQKIYIEGYSKTRIWRNRYGRQITSTSINVDSVQILS